MSSSEEEIASIEGGEDDKKKKSLHGRFKKAAVKRAKQTVRPFKNAAEAAEASDSPPGMGGRGI